MRMGLGFGLLAAITPALAVAQAAQLSVSIGDGNPWDQVVLHNTGNCKASTGTLSIDFSGAKGRFLIDTAYGGPGTKDPMPVKVLSGLITVAPVADGARTLTIRIGAIPAGERAVVGLDLDNEQGFWNWQRVEIDSQGLAGTTLDYRSGTFTAQAQFSDSGVARLDLPDTACKPDLPEDLTVPTS